MTNLIPLNDRVFVRKDGGRSKSSGGILIPESAKEHTFAGTVTAAAPSLSVEAGDRVLIGKFTGTAVKVNDEELLCMREEDIFAVIEGEE